MTEIAPFQIVASDMDGTVLNSKHEMSEYTMETLFEISTKYGVAFVFATGRHFLAVKKARNELCAYFAKRCGEHTTSPESLECDNTAPLEGGTPASGASAAPGFFLITSNGARIHNLTSKLIFSHNLDSDIVKKLYQRYGLLFTTCHGQLACNEGDGSSLSHMMDAEVAELIATVGQEGEMAKEIVCTSAYTSDQWFMTHPSVALSDMEKKFGVRPFVVPFDADDPNNADKSVFDNFPLEGVGKVCFRSSHPRLLDAIECSINEEFGERVSVALSSSQCLDVMAGNTSKATALATVVNLLSSERAQKRDGEQPLTMKDVVAFGDSMNDEAMLRAAGKGCVMMNADSRLKKVLPDFEIIGDNDANGVAVKLREIFHLPPVGT